MYYRLYATKNNTIFQQFSPNTSTPLSWSTTINTGNNPVVQLMDGAAVSKILFGFDVPDWLRSKLNAYDYSCNIVMYDAGAQYNSLLPLKEIKIEYFSDDFAEGDGWYFNEHNGTPGVSNWLNNLDNALWSDVTFVPAATYHLNKNNEDLKIDITNSIVDNISNPLLNFAVSVTDPQLDENTLIKFIWGKHTKTVFKPYLEFFIADGILDNVYNLVAGQVSKIYFVNDNNTDFTDELTATVTLNDGSTSTVTATSSQLGKYYIEITAIEPSSFVKKEYVNVIWKIGTVSVYKQIIEVLPQNNFIGGVNYRNLMFYPTTPYTHNIVRQDDIIPFELISIIRGQGDVIMNTFEYRVISQDGFEMIPWTPVNVYRNKMTFDVMTEFFYPEKQYEVFVRNSVNGSRITSNTTYKFKLTTNEASHLRELSATPYYNRTSFFGK